ncbi:MAG TPA: hypothetical protein PKX69_10720 [Limnochordia bacterium]|nr:hypothetical protein [Limnochordia bacterium]
MADEIAGMAKLAHGRQRGAMPGMGHSPSGHPWGGIVEDVPHLWITWLVEAAKAAGHTLDETSLEIEGKRVKFSSVQLTFGRRWYFVAPCCGRPVEALYFLPGGAVGCRKCLHLGYASQVTRPASIWRLLEGVFHRRSLNSGRYEESDNPVIAQVVEPVRRLMAARIEEMFKRIEVRNGEAESS